MIRHTSLHLLSSFTSQPLRPRRFEAEGSDEFAGVAPVDLMAQVASLVFELRLVAIQLA